MQPLRLHVVQIAAKVCGYEQKTVETKQDWEKLLELKYIWQWNLT